MPLESPASSREFLDSEMQKISRITRVYSRPEDITLARTYFGLTPKNGYEGIDKEFIQKIYSFQQSQNLSKKDGILGPATLSKIRQVQEKSGIRAIPEITGVSQTIGENTLKIPLEWQSIFAEMRPKLGPGAIDRIRAGAPLLLVNPTTRQGYALLGEKSFSFPVALGRGGTQAVSSTSGMRELQGTGKTATNIVYNFTSTRIPRNDFGDASLSGKSREEVIGASLISPEGQVGGGRWWHGVSDTSSLTAGCVGLPVPEIRSFAQAVREYGAGYGYVANVG